MKQIVILSVIQTCKILKEHGMPIHPNHLRAGIECGAYPFGVAVKMEKSCVFEIFEPLLMEWIDERSAEVPAAEKEESA